MFEVNIKADFSAAHHLKEYNGQCSSQHGHNWEVEVSLRGPETNALGILVDFRQVKSAVYEILGQFDHHDLNTLPIFADKNPSSENLAKFFYETFSKKLNNEHFSVYQVCVSETPKTRACYRQEL